MSSRRVAKTFWRRLQEVLKTFSIPLENIFKTSSKYVFKTFSRRIVKFNCLTRVQHVLETSGKPSSRHLQDIFKTSSRRLEKMSSRHLQDLSSSSTVIVSTSSRRFWDVFKMFLWRTAKTVIYRRICLGRTSEKFMVSV